MKKGLWRCKEEIIDSIGVHLYSKKSSNVFDKFNIKIYIFLPSLQLLFYSKTFDTLNHDILIHQHGECSNLSFLIRKNDFKKLPFQPLIQVFHRDLFSAHLFFFTYKRLQVFRCMLITWRCMNEVKIMQNLVSAMLTAL